MADTMVSSPRVHNTAYDRMKIESDIRSVQQRIDDGDKESPFSHADRDRIRRFFENENILFAYDLSHADPYMTLYCLEYAKYKYLERVSLSHAKEYVLNMHTPRSLLISWDRQGEQAKRTAEKAASPAQNMIVPVDESVLRQSKIDLFKIPIPENSMRMRELGMALDSSTRLLNTTMNSITDESTRLKEIREEEAKEASRFMFITPKGELLVVDESEQKLIDEYEETARRIGYEPNGLMEKRLKLFLAENKIPIYDFQHVSRYMDQVAEAQGKRWGWVPMRSKDLNCHSRAINSRVYKEIIPIEVLKTVETILSRFPEAHFFVTLIVSYPDPFIAVSIDNSELMVFAHWDEPAFTIVLDKSSETPSE